MTILFTQKIYPEKFCTARLNKAEATSLKAVSHHLKADRSTELNARISTGLNAEMRRAFSGEYYINSNTTTKTHSGNAYLCLKVSAPIAGVMSK